MKHSRSNFGSWLLAVGCWLMATGATARPFLHDLNIRVVLNRNGDAQITETRLMDIDSEGTECYEG